jgi:hypothetical protein
MSTECPKPQTQGHWPAQAGRAVVHGELGLGELSSIGAGPSWSAEQPGTGRKRCEMAELFQSIKISRRAKLYDLSLSLQGISIDPVRQEICRSGSSLGQTGQWAQ